MTHSRLIGGKPKIGIRPIIDGRRGGIRESLEDMTMTMAHKVAELYSSSLRHSDGTPVECIIADTTIGGVAEAAMAAEKFRNNGVGVVLSVTPCWCNGFETIDMDGEMPKAGDLTEPSVRVLFIWLLPWQDIHRRDCRHLAFMGGMYRKLVTRRSRKMCKRN